MTQVVTHRGLDPSKPHYFLESSLEAFNDQTKRGFGLEFDPQLTADNEIVAQHDYTLGRISGGQQSDAINSLPLSVITSLVFNGCHIPSIDQVLDCIRTLPSGVISAVHLKSKNQTPKHFEVLVQKLLPTDFERLIFFDVTIENAELLKKMDARFVLAPSVAHPYDVAHYNSATGGTLYAFDDIKDRRDIFDWVWLDEWDLSDAGGKEKKLYTLELFAQLRDRGFKIGLVTPELHGTSPALLGGESHPDALNHEKLFKRIEEIVALGPDLVCTDYPDRVAALIKKY